MEGLERLETLRYNDQIADRLRGRFLRADVVAIHLLGLPGVGRTTLLDRTLDRLPTDTTAVILHADTVGKVKGGEGVAQDDGRPVQPVCTDGVCHLEAEMVERALQKIDGRRYDVVFIENTANLLCPVRYDLGEHCRVVMLSVTGGEDKPLEYPAAIARASLVIINKTDLLPHVPFNLEQARACVHAVHPGLEIIETSCTTGEGIDLWISWVRSRLIGVRCPTAFLHGIR